MTYFFHWVVISHLWQITAWNCIFPLTLVSLIISLFITVESYAAFHNCSSSRWITIERTTQLPECMEHFLTATYPSSRLAKLHHSFIPSQIVISSYSKQREGIQFSLVPLIQLRHASSPMQNVHEGTTAHNVYILRHLNDITSGLNCLADSFIWWKCGIFLCITTERWCYNMIRRH